MDIICYWRCGHKCSSADCGQVGVMRAVGAMCAEPERTIELLVGRLPPTHSAISTGHNTTCGGA